MTAANDKRLSLVEWCPRAGTLVFKNTRAPLAALWAALAAPGGLNGFLTDHPEVSGRAVLRTLRIAGDLLMEWPVDKAERAAAYRAAVAEQDVRFTSGAVLYDPAIRGGRLLCGGDSYHGLQVVWDNLAGGTPIGQIMDWFDLLRPGTCEKIIAAAASLFEKGLVPGEDIPRQ